MAIRKEDLGEGYQPPLFVVSTVDDQVRQKSIEEAHKRKIGLLTRISSGKTIGDLLDDKRTIEASFKAGGSREMAYLYDTKVGRQMVLVTPEDIQCVINQRRTKRKAG